MTENSGGNPNDPINLWTVPGLWRRGLFLFCIVVVVHSAIPAALAALTRSATGTLDSLFSVLVYMVLSSALICALMAGLARSLRSNRSDRLIYSIVFWPPIRGLMPFAVLWGLSTSISIAAITTEIDNFLLLGETHLFMTLILAGLQFASLAPLGSWLFGFPAPKKARHSNS